MSEHTQLKHKPANTSGTSFLSSGGDTAFAPPTSTSLSRESGTALQTAPDRPSSVQETTPDQETADLQAQLESQYSLAYDFGSMAIARPTGTSVANSAEEPPRSNGTHPTIQRKGLSSSRSSVAVHAPVQGHDFSRIAIQPKLTIGQPDDSYEQEADRIAEQVMQMPESEDAPAESVQEFSGHDFSQISILPQLQPAAEPVEVSRGLEQQLTQSQGGGNPLADETRSFMESRFGADLSAVRVHTDTSAAQMNQALNAQAFTHGNDIYFGAGTSPGKNDLTAHELTHTIQQTGHSAAYQPKPFLDSPMSGDLEQFGSASHRWGAASSQIQKQPISVAQAFSIQRRAGSSTLAEDNQDTKQTRSDAITAPSPRDGHPPTPSISEGAASTTEDPYKSQPTTENQPASQDNAQNIKQNHKIAPPTSTGSAANDPDFQAVAARGQELAQAQQQHDPAESESREAQDAAQAPSNEVTSKAQDRQVGEMAEQQPGEFNAQAFKDAIFKELETAMPGNLEAAENFDQNNDLDSVRQKVSSDVGAERDETAAPIEETTQEEPDPSGIEPKLETPMQPPDRGAAPGAIGAEQATPKPKSDAEVSQPLEANQQEIDQQMAEADITEEQLANANEPEFTAALDAKREVKANAEQAPAAYRQQEQTTLNQAQTEAQTTAATQLEGMHNQRQDSMAQVEGLQGETKSADEQKRTEIADHINGIYERVKGEVETSLSTLETDVTTKFDTAANTARRVFEDYIKREKGKFLSDRYFGDPARQGREAGEQFAETLGFSGSVSEFAGYVGAGWNMVTTGGARVINDTLTGLPPEVEGIFAKGREQYLADMSVALDEIATTVATRLTEAMQKIEGGRQDIKKYVDSLSPNLRQIGQEAATSIESKFDDLEQQVRDKHDQLVDTLAQKYQERLKEIDSRIEEMKAENRGLFDRAMDAIGGVIQTISEIKAMLQGLLADAMTAIGMILRDPIGFLDNLLKALNQGFNQFLENIGEHLQSGLIGWLTGAIGAAGIQMPENIFSLEGIFSLAAQILGFGWEFIRDKAVGMFGESTVAAMEENVDIFQTLKNDGLKGLWQQIQSQFTDLKETVMDEVQSIITVEVIQAGVTWVLSLFNPASAFIRAAKMIVDVIIFFVENASQIMELVQAVIQSITAIASGSIGAAADAIENALARAIPVLIGLLASLLGIGGLANKVQDVFERIRKRIDAAIEKLLKKVKQLFKGEKGKDNEEENDKDKNDKENDAENTSDVTLEKQRDVDDATPRQDADDMESDRDITSPSSNRRRKSNEQQSDEDTSVDASDRQRPKDGNEDTDTTPDAKRDRQDDQDTDVTPGTKRDRHDDQDTDTTPDAKRDRYDDRDPEAPRRDKSDQPDQRRRDQDDPDQQRRRDQDQDADWVDLRRKFQTIGKESHTLFFKPKGKGAQLTICSTEMSIEEFLSDLATKYAEDEQKLKQVNTAQGIVEEIKKLTAPATAQTDVSPNINSPVQEKVDQLKNILIQIGDGVSTKGATAAYRGLHWWVDKGQAPEDASTEPGYLENLARQELGAQQLSDAVRALLSQNIPDDTMPTQEEIDIAIILVKDKVSSIRDAAPYQEERVKYFDRFHFLLGRYVTKLQAVRTRFQQAAQQRELIAEIRSLRGQIRTLQKDSTEYYQAKQRQREAAQELKRIGQVPKVYNDLAPDVTASPFIATSLSAKKAAEYAIGSLFEPKGKERRKIGRIGRMFIFVASVTQLVEEGTYSIDELAGEGKIKIRKGFTENELTFTGTIPGEYLKATLEVEAGQTADDVASNAKIRAEAEAARFGGLK